MFEISRLQFAIHFICRCLIVRSRSFSKKFSGSELNYSTYEKELFAVILSVKKFSHYLKSGRFTIYTDNSAVSALLKQPLAENTRVTRWITYLLSFDFNIIHRNGKVNQAADFCSRHPVAAITEDPDEDSTSPYQKVYSFLKNQPGIFSETLSLLLASSVSLTISYIARAHLYLC